MSNRATLASLRDFAGSLPECLGATRGDLILGFAVGYTPEAIAPFVESVRADGQFEGQIVLFVKSAAQNALSEKPGYRDHSLRFVRIGDGEHRSRANSRLFSIPSGLL